MFAIDVSHHNGKINWSAVKDALDPVISFAYIKATNGTGLDPMFDLNVTRAAKSQMPFGLYHFAMLNSMQVEDDARRQAANLVSALRQCNSTIRPTLDIEENPLRIPVDQVLLWVQCFMSEMEKAGYNDVGIYTNRGFADYNFPANHDLGKYPLWHSQYSLTQKPALPRGWSSCWLWQFSDKAKIPGIETNCDLSKTMDQPATPPVS